MPGHCAVPTAAVPTAAVVTAHDPMLTYYYYYYYYYYDPMLTAPARTVPCPQPQLRPCAKATLEASANCGPS
jgi:hypothetical protein